MEERDERLLWLRSLQPGQGCVIKLTAGDYWLFTVERRTATQIIGKTDTGREMRFNRKSGYQVANHFGPELMPLTPKVRDSMELRQLTTWLYTIAGRNDNSPKLAQLKAMKKAYDRVAYEENIKEALDKGVVIQ